MNAAIYKEQILSMVREQYKRYLPDCHGVIGEIEKNIIEMSTEEGLPELFIDPGHTRMQGFYNAGEPAFVVSVGELDCREVPVLPEDENKLPVFAMRFADVDHMKKFAENLMKVVFMIEEMEEGRNG